VEKVREKGATSGAGVLAVYGYDDLGRRTSLTRGNGSTTSYGYDAVSRLSSLSHDFSGTTQDLTLGFSYNPADQIVSATRSNDLYAWDKHGSGTTSSSANGRNQLSSHAGATPTYDARGNLTNDGSVAYTYSSENLLTSTGSSGPLEYDPLMRFYKNYTQYFIHEAGSGQLIGDYYNGNIVGRYVPGAAPDEPVGYIDKFGNRIWHHSDERGSVIAGSNGTGAVDRIVLYDEYGRRGSGGSYRFAYTGEVHLINDVYDYKNRNYYARLGRFGQPDPIGYASGMNLYTYVEADPVNFIDPWGLDGDEGEIVVNGHCNWLCKLRRAINKMLGDDSSSDGGATGSWGGGGFTGGGGGSTGGGGATGTGDWPVHIDRIRATR
jgi:RHS repeat-associated protein